VSEFIVYFINRVNTLFRMGREIEFIATTNTTLKQLGLPKDMTFLRTIPVTLFDVEAPMFAVKRKDTRKHEDWLEDYELDPEPAWDLMVIINERRRRHGLLTHGPAPAPPMQNQRPGYKSDLPGDGMK
jgi:hypothetical protein